MALQTNVEWLKKQLIAESENEIMTVRRHGIRFVLDIIVKTIIALVLMVVLSIGLQIFSGMTRLLILVSLFPITSISYCYQILSSYIAWRFNFLIVTSDKIIVINHQSFIHQKVNSIHLDTVARSDYESQYFGIFRCGIVHIHLKEQVQDSTRIITIRDVPTPDTVASAIEKALGMKQQRGRGTETPAEQEQKAEIIKKNLKVEAKEPPVNTPPPVPEQSA